MRFIAAFCVVILLGSSAHSAMAAPCIPSGTANADYLRCREEVAIRTKNAHDRLREAQSLPPKEADAAHLEIGQALLDAWSDGFSAACKAGDKKWCDNSEEDLYSAALAFRLAGARDKAAAARAMLLDPQNGLSTTRMAALATYDAGKEALRFFEFETAASAFETFAKKLPKASEARDALDQAFVLRLALADRAAAEKILDTIERLGLESEKGRLSLFVFALADGLAGAEQWAEVEALLTKRGALVSKADEELRLQVNALRGRAFASQNKAREADAAYSQVAKYPIEKLVQKLADEPFAARAVGASLEAIGEAKIHQAGRLQAEFLKLSLKRGDKRSLSKKQESLDAAEKAYLAVLQLQPLPPPRATVAAAGKIARMHSQLWAQAHLALGSDAAEPFLARAKAAQLMCINLGAKYQVEDAGTIACAAWLARHYPKEHPAMVEPLPAFKANGVGLTPPAPLDENGAAVVTAQHGDRSPPAP